METHPKITVLMPAYNAEKYIAEAINSVLCQTFTDFEFLIINDGSTDHTEKIIRSFNDPRIVILNQSNKGIVEALNIGLLHAKAPLIARFDADDICYPDRLAKQFAFLTSHPDYAIVGAGVDYIDMDGEYIYTYTPPGCTDEEIGELPYMICPFIHSVVMYQKCAIIEHGGYNIHAHSFEDHLLWRNVIGKEKVFNLSEPLLKVRLNSQSITIDDTWRTKEFISIKQKALRENNIDSTEGERLLITLKWQNNRKTREGAYYSLLAKKFLWNNYQPSQSRKNIFSALRAKPLQLTGYGLLVLSFLPEKFVIYLHRQYKSNQGVYKKKAMNEPGQVKVFVDAHVFDGSFQGTRTFINEIYTLIAKKEDVQLFLGAFNTDHLKTYFQDAPNIAFVKYKSRSGFNRLLFDIPAIIKKHGIQYAHFQYISPILKRCKHIVTVHDVLFCEYPQFFSVPFRLIKKALYRMSASRADIVTTVSGYSKGSVQKYLGISAEKIHVVPNGVSEKYFEEYDKQRAKDFVLGKYGFGKFLLFVSRIEPRKNHVSLLDAWLDLKLYEEGYWLVLVGSESILSPVFEKRLSELIPEIRKWIFISSGVGEEDLLQFYRAADVFVYPSKAEGFGIPPLEAGALKVPVICSDASAMSDFQFFGDHLVDMSNQQLFKNRLYQVLHSPVNESCLNKVSGIIHEKYSWKSPAENLHRLIKNSAYPSTVSI